MNKEMSIISLSLLFCAALLANGSSSFLRSGEFLLDTSLVGVPAPHEQQNPTMVCSGENCLVVWEDRRDDTRWQVYGARVTPDGVVLDPVGIAISSSMYDDGSPSVAFDGTNYLVTWTRYNDGIIDIYGARVTTAGVVLDTAEIPISTAPDCQWYPAVAYDGMTYLVVWSDFRSSSTYDVYGARVTPGGIVLDTNGFAISTAANDQFARSLAFDGENYLVLWSDMRNGSCDIYGARITTGGVVLDSTGIAVSAAPDDQVNPMVVFGHADYLVAWEDYRNVCDIYGARVTLTGIVLDTAGIMISANPSSQFSPSVAFDGENYLVVWSDQRNGACDVYGARVTQNGTVLDTAGIDISSEPNTQGPPSVSFDGDNYLVAWGDTRSFSYSDIYGTRVTSAGIVIDTAGIIVSTIAYHQISPSVAFDSTDYLVVWQDWRNGSFSDIYGARISPDGAVLDPTSIAITTEAGDQVSPSVAFNSENFLAVWADNGNAPGIHCARVTQNGTLLDTAGIMISAGLCYNPAVAFDGINYLVVWEEYRSSSYPDIYGARVAPDGVVLDPAGIAISIAENHQGYPSVAFDGENYIVVWEDHRTAYPNYYDIYGARVTPDGIVLDPEGIAISYAYNSQHYPTIAFNGILYMVVWEDYRNGSYPDIYSARVAPDGYVFDPDGIAIGNAVYGQYSPSIAVDAGDFLILWDDYRSNLSRDIFGARVTQSGTIEDTFLVSDQPGNQVAPVVARGQGGQLLIVYSGFVDSINSRPAYTMRIWGKFYPFTGMTEDAQYRIPIAGCKLSVFPNPFRGMTNIDFQIPIRHDDYHIRSQPATNLQTVLKIYNSAGQLVRSYRFPANLLREYSRSSASFSASVIWDGRDEQSRMLTSGVYFCRLNVDGSTITRKIVKVR